ncbi:MAG: hypothetical protein J6T14_07910 [Clostridia bacterium]|nr:hypothetical protein [Clostridia bacterium]
MLSSNLSFGFVQDGVQKDMDEDYWYLIDSSTYKGTPTLNLSIQYQGSTNSYTTQGEPTKLYSDAALTKEVKAGEKYEPLMVTPAASAYKIDLTDLPGDMKVGETYYWVLPGELFRSSLRVGKDVIVEFVYNEQIVTTTSTTKKQDESTTPTAAPVAKRNGVVQGPDGKWGYYVDDALQTGYTGIKSNSYGWWRIENGLVNFNATGVYKNEYGWWRVEEGKVNFKAQEIYKNSYGWWKTTDGKVTFNENGVFKNSYGWWKVKDSKVDFGYTGVAKNQYGWWRIEKGKVNFKFTGIAKNEYGTWYLKDGKVDFNKNGKVNYNGQTYTVKDGKAKLA